MNLTQKQRLCVLVVYTGLLFVISRVALGTWLPPASEKGLWFFGALLSLLLGDLIVSPYFTKPADALAYAVAALAVLAGARSCLGDHPRPLDAHFWLILLAYLVVIIAAASLAILLKDNQRSTLARFSASCYILCDTLASPRLIYIPLFVFLVVAFHRKSLDEFLWIGCLGLLVVASGFLERATVMLQRLISIWKAGGRLHVVGQVIAQREPGVALLRIDTEDTMSFGDPVAVRCSDDHMHIGVVLDRQRLAGESWLRVLELPHETFTESARRQVGSLCPEQGLAVRLNLKALSDKGLADEFVKFSESIIGIVAADTTTSTLYFEVVRADQDIREGSLVEVKVGEGDALFQVISGITKEQILAQKSAYGYARGAARKIGRVSGTPGVLEPVAWMPLLNEPVRLKKCGERNTDPTAVGFLPDTEFPVRVDMDALITHNCAVLGILGVGKTCLAAELVERAIQRGIKVVCVDLTHQYAKLLGVYYDMTAEGAAIDEIKKVGPPGKASCKKNIHEGGSAGAFRAAVEADLRTFLQSKSMLKIYNPTDFEVWRQTGGMFNETAAMAVLTPPEVTQIVTESTLTLLQEQGFSDKARVCLVLEEAHSLVPEFNAVVSDGDKAATNGTARAILQGRKFGLGCLLITQRTANVTKSILNQCNTVFALRVYDATGMEFLKNYIGDDFAQILSSLEDRHAVAFGKAVSFTQPVMLRLNDRDDFIVSFRTAVQCADQVGYPELEPNECEWSPQDEDAPDESEEPYDPTEADYDAVDGPGIEEPP